MGWDEAAVFSLRVVSLTSDASPLEKEASRSQPATAVSPFLVPLLLGTDLCHLPLSSFSILFFFACCSLAGLAVKRGTALHLTCQKLSREDSVYVCFEALVSWAAGI